MRVRAAVLREIGRLRELSFRAASEGTGNSLDLDRFDAHYLHLFVWNEAASEIVGAYRLGRAEFEVRNFIDGRRSLLDIRNAASAEYGPLPLQAVRDYIDLLKNMGFVEVVPASSRRGARRGA